MTSVTKRDSTTAFHQSEGAILETPMDPLLPTEKTAGSALL